MGYLWISRKSRVSGLDQLPIAIGHDESQRSHGVDGLSRVHTDYTHSRKNGYWHTQETALGLSQVKAGVWGTVTTSQCSPFREEKIWTPFAGIRTPREEADKWGVFCLRANVKYIVEVCARVCLLLLTWDRFPLCSPGWPGIRSVEHVGLKLTEIHLTSASWGLRLKACTTKLAKYLYCQHKHMHLDKGKLIVFQQTSLVSNLQKKTSL